MQLVLDATPAGLAPVRRALEVIGEEAGMAGERLDDMKVAVTEACANIVQHAHDGTGGRMRVHAWLQSDRVVVLVRDRGVGMMPRPARPSPGLGLGMGMITTLASDVRITSDPGMGTDVWMSFPLAAR
jgi:serine/threonine-protein kinase RsbW